MPCTSEPCGCCCLELPEDVTMSSAPRQDPSSSILYQISWRSLASHGAWRMASARPANSPVPHLHIHVVLLSRVLFNASHLSDHVAMRERQIARTAPHLGSRGRCMRIRLWLRRAAVNLLHIFTKHSLAAQIDDIVHYASRSKSNC